MEKFLYFGILCLIYAVSNKAVELYVPIDFWFLSGWVIGLIVAMIYKMFLEPDIE